MSEINDIRENLWAARIAEPPGAADASAILEQYKLYVASAEKISANRLAANTFFLSFNTALVGALAGFYEKIASSELIDAFYIAAIVLCLAWMLLLRSYRNLNSAKFKVIGMIEERLPMSPFWRAEWTALGQGADYRKYIPLSLIEQAAPAAFLFIYAFLLAVM